jgi:hypothetical protein
MHPATLRDIHTVLKQDMTVQNKQRVSQIAIYNENQSLFNYADSYAAVTWRYVPRDTNPLYL